MHHSYVIKYKMFTLGRKVLFCPLLLQHNHITNFPSLEVLSIAIRLWYETHFLKK